MEALLKGTDSWGWIDVVDSHTGGEPTRIITSGGPPAPVGSMAEVRSWLAREHDWLRRTVNGEPRGSDVLVSGLVCPSSADDCAAGVVFFNNVGYLGMCGHGMIGLCVTLGHLGQIAAGRHRIETPVGVVQVAYDGGNRVTVENVPSYRYRKGVRVQLTGTEAVTGDVAWGGNWFFLIRQHDQQLDPKRVEQLVDYTWRIRQALEREGITGADGGVIDHIELFGPPSGTDADSRNFVLCPGKAYDRSPCGTGTSAKLACLMADGEVAEGAIWRQEGFVGSVFEASGRWEGERVVPSITGTAFVTAQCRLWLDPSDPYRNGLI